MTDASSLPVWLRQQIQTDRDLARDAAISGAWKLSGYSHEECAIESLDPTSMFRIYDEGGHTRRQAEHIVRWHPVAALADLDAKLAIITEYESLLEHREQYSETAEGWGARTKLEYVLRLIAAPYADRDGYLDEWRVG